MAQRRGSTAAAWLGAAASLLAIGCKNPTQITLTISSDACGSPTETSIYVGSPGSVGADAPVASTDACNGGYVGSLVIVPSGADDEMVGILVVMATQQGADAGGGLATCTPTDEGPSCIVARRALPYLPHANVRLSVDLDSICEGVVCDPSATCVQGRCVDDTITDPASCTWDDGGCGDQALTGDAGPPPPIDGGADATLHDGGPPVDAKAADAPQEAATDGMAVGADAACATAGGCYTIPSSAWAFGGLSLSPDGSCPSGLTSASVLADPQPPAGACTYACSPGDAPGCTGPVNAVNCLARFGVGSFPGVDGGCNEQSFSFVGAIFDGPAGSGGSCQSSVDAAAASTTSGVSCTQAAPALCDGGTCHAVFAPPFHACIYQPGPAQPCPPDSPFTEQHIVGTDPTVTCPPATCTATGSCTGTITFFPMAMCAGAPTPLPVDSQTCNAPNGFGTTATSSYKVTLSGTTSCGTPVPSGPPSAAFGTPGETFCCIP